MSFKEYTGPCFEEVTKEVSFGEQVGPRIGCYLYPTVSYKRMKQNVILPRQYPCRPHAVPKAMTPVWRGYRRGYGVVVIKVWRETAHQR